MYHEKLELTLGCYRIYTFFYVVWWNADTYFVTTQTDGGPNYQLVQNTRLSPMFPQLPPDIDW